MWLCFGFVLETPLIIPGSFSQSEGLFCLSQPAASKVKLGAREAAHGAGQRTEQGMFPVLVFVFPGDLDVWWSPAFLHMAEH